MIVAEKKTVLLRLNPKLWGEINQWAEDEFRSINGQIEYLLTQAVQQHRKKVVKQPETEPDRKSVV